MKMKSLMALLSSSTARFGRKGQVDYAAANEALNKLAQAFARRHPSCSVCAFNFGPWRGGMVTPALEEVFRSEGVGVVVTVSDGGVFTVASSQLLHEEVNDPFPCVGQDMHCVSAHSTGGRQRPRIDQHGGAARLRGSEQR